MEKRIRFILTISLISSIFSVGGHCSEKTLSVIKDSFTANSINAYHKSASCVTLIPDEGKDFCCYASLKYELNDNDYERTGCVSITLDDYNNLKSCLDLNEQNLEGLIKRKTGFEAKHLKLKTDCYSNFLKYFGVMFIILILLF